MYVLETSVERLFNFMFKQKSSKYPSYKKYFHPVPDVPQEARSPRAIPGQNDRFKTAESSSGLRATWHRQR